MKFINNEGQIIIVNLTHASITKRVARSQYQDNVGHVLREQLSNLDIYSEFNVGGLFFDFFIPSIKLMVEVDGEQHDKFNKFFHKTGSKFVNAIKRDEEKNKFCELNDITLVRLNVDEAMNQDIIMTRIKNELEC